MQLYFILFFHGEMTQVVVVVSHENRRPTFFSNA